MVQESKSGCGGDTCIVTAGLLSSFCTPELNGAHTFLSAFGKEPVWGPIDDTFGVEPDYEATVGAALAEVVGQTCDELKPEG